MNNRLGELPSWANEPDDDDEDDDDLKKPEADIEKGRPTTKQEIDKAIFFTAVEEIKGKIAHIIEATADVERINEQAQKATTTEKEQELSRRLRKTIDTTNKQAKAAKNLIGELKAENEQLKKQGELKASDLRYVPCFEVLVLHAYSVHALCFHRKCLTCATYLATARVPTHPYVTAKLQSTGESTEYVDTKVH